MRRDRGIAISSGNFCASFGRLSLNSLASTYSVKENLTVRIDSVDSFVYSPVESLNEVICLCFRLCSVHECCTSAFRLSSQFHWYSLHFSVQQSTVRELVHLPLTLDLDND